MLFLKQLRGKREILTCLLFVIANVLSQLVINYRQRFWVFNVIVSYYVTLRLRSHKTVFASRNKAFRRRLEQQPGFEIRFWCLVLSVNRTTLSSRLMPSSDISSQLALHTGKKFYPWLQKSHCANAT